MISDIKTGFGLISIARNAIRRWRNIPIIEEQRRTIDNLRSQIASLQASMSGIVKNNLSLQEKISTQQGRIGYLEEENMTLKDWNSEAEQYELCELPPRVFVRASKEPACNGKPPHYICADCYNRSIKSLLHVTDEIRGQTYFTCHTCHTTLKVGEKQPYEPPKRRKTRKGLVI